MTANEKVKYIINDYIENVIDKVGEVKATDKWFDNYKQVQSNFLLRYKDNSMSQFATRLANLYGYVVDGEYMSLLASDRSKRREKRSDDKITTEEK